MNDIIWMYFASPFLVHRLVAILEVKMLVAISVVDGDEKKKGALKELGGKVLYNYVILLLINVNAMLLPFRRFIMKREP